MDNPSLRQLEVLIDYFYNLKCFIIILNCGGGKVNVLGNHNPFSLVYTSMNIHVCLA